MTSVRSRIQWPIHPAIPQDHFESMYEGELDNMLATPVLPPFPIAPFGLALVTGEDKLEGLVKLSKAFVDAMMSSHGCAPLCMLVFCTRDPMERLAGPLCYAIGHRVGTTMNEGHKALIAHLARTVAMQGRARACVMVAESWSVQTSDKEGLEKWIDEHGTVEGHPDAQDGVTIMIEHARGTRTLQCAILSDVTRIARGKVLGPWNDHGYLNGGGRFADILNAPEKKEN